MQRWCAHIPLASVAWSLPASTQATDIQATANANIRRALPIHPLRPCSLVLQHPCHYSRHQHSCQSLRCPIHPKHLHHHHHPQIHHPPLRPLPNLTLQHLVCPPPTFFTSSTPFPSLPILFVLPSLPACPPPGPSPMTLLWLIIYVIYVQRSQPGPRYLPRYTAPPLC